MAHVVCIRCDKLQENLTIHMTYTKDIRFNLTVGADKKIRVFFCDNGGVSLLKIII